MGFAKGHLRAKFDSGLDWLHNAATYVNGVCGTTFTVSPPLSKVVRPISVHTCNIALRGVSGFVIWRRKFEVRITASK